MQLHPRSYLLSALHERLTLVSQSSQLQQMKNNLRYFSDLFLLQKYLAENSPVVIQDGRVIADNHDAMLDKLCNLDNNNYRFLINLEQCEHDLTKVTTLKVDHNRIRGYYTKISRVQAKRVPTEYIRQIKNTERCIIPELKNFKENFEDKVLSSCASALAREKELYEQLIMILIEKLIPLRQYATDAAELDVLNILPSGLIYLTIKRINFPMISQLFILQRVVILSLKQ